VVGAWGGGGAQQQVSSEKTWKKECEGKQKGNHVRLLQSRLTLSTGDVAHERY
jgi:hypothetical protein